MALYVNLVKVVGADDAAAVWPVAWPGHVKPIFHHTLFLVYRWLYFPIRLKYPGDCRADPPDTYPANGIWVFLPVDEFNPQLLHNWILWEFEKMVGGSPMFATFFAVFWHYFHTSLKLCKQNLKTWYPVSRYPQDSGTFLGVPVVRILGVPTTQPQPPFPSKPVFGHRTFKKDQCVKH